MAVFRENQRFLGVFTGVIVVKCVAKVDIGRLLFFNFLPQKGFPQVPAVFRAKDGKGAGSLARFFEGMVWGLFQRESPGGCRGFHSNQKRPPSF
jgi:hypothetical protein